jgi:iron complex outermembrane receptor protein
MKIYKCLLVAVLSIYKASGQNNLLASPDDTARIIELREVKVNAVQKTQQQRLVSFFRANEGATLEEIMSRLPEITMIRRGSYGMEPTIRGFAGDQVNVLIDGMRIHGACTDKMDPVTIYIEPINLENLQVQTAASGFFHSSSTGGTINMKTAEPDFATPGKLSGVLNSGYQSAANSFYESMWLNYASGKWGVRASGTYRHNGNYRSGGGSVVPFSQYEKTNYSLSVKYKYNDNTYIKADMIGDDGWNIGYPALPMDVGYAGARIVSVRIHHSNTEKMLAQWQAKIYANRVQHYMDDTHRPNVPMHMDMPGLSKTAGIITDGEMKISKNQKLFLKADISSTFLNASMTMYQPGQLPMYMLTWPDNRKLQSGLSAIWTWHANSLTKIQINSRADIIDYRLTTDAAKDQLSIWGHEKTSRNNWLKNFSLQVSQKLSRRFKTNISISSSERMPSASELYGFYLFNSQDGFDYIGNPDLKKENNIQADLSLSYISNKSRIQVNLFYNHIFNYITGAVQPGISSMTIGSRGVKTYINLNDAIVTGMEASLILKPTMNTDFISTVRYLYGKLGKDEPFPFISPLKNISTFRYQPGRFSFQMEYESALAQNRYSALAGEDITPGYFLVHTRLGYTTVLFKKGMEWQAGAENIFDVKYHEHSDWVNVPRAGRNFYVQMKFQF